MMKYFTLRNRKGFSLLLLLVILPALLVLYMTLQSRLVAAMAATKRGEDRAQARLLAESALLLFQDDLKIKGLDGWHGRALPKGEIAGKGSYQVSIPARDSGGRSPRRIVAMGRVAGRQQGITCEIQAEVGATTSSTPANPLRVTGLQYHN